MVRIDAFVVCVNYAGELSLTLPEMMKHFATVNVITSMEDGETTALVRSTGGNANLIRTGLFYANGATFNKGAAIDAVLRQRAHAWTALVDADVLFPRDWRWPSLLPGNLYTAPRRMCYKPHEHPRPHEIINEDWELYPFKVDHEWAGYLQLFHTDDPNYRHQPGYPACYTHAGICDSMFQQRWPRRRKVRFEQAVLHLGVDGQNWAGRSSPYLDGSLPAGADEKRAKLGAFIKGRGHGPDRFAGEMVQ